MAQQVSKMIGGVTPGGVVTVTPGTPIPLTVNLNLVKTPYSLMCRQIGFSLDATAAGEIYVNYGDTPGKGNQTALIIQSGTTQALPVNSRCTEGEIDANKWYIDGSAACVVAISFVDASN